MASFTKQPDNAYTELTALFLAGQQGDSASYSQFLTETTRLLRVVLARKLPFSDVEDVVQEVLLSVHKARHTYDGARPLMPWLMAIMQFRLKDHLRKVYKDRLRNVSDDALENFPAESVTKHADSFESMEDMLKHVPDRDRSILTLMHGHGLTARETGQKLGMKESAVKVAAHRALKKLREMNS